METPKGAIMLQDLAAETKKDPELSKGLEDVRSGRLSPQTSSTPYGKIYEELSCSNEVVL